MNNQHSQVKRWLRKPVLTYAFLGIQIIVFLIDYIFPDIGIQSLGGMSRLYVTHFHEYWRFFTPIFIHFGLEHILFNSIVLYFMGQQVEMLYGHWRYLLIYLLSGGMGNLFSMAFNSPNTLSAGASSSILGLFGAFLVFGFHYKNNPAVQQMTRNFLLFVVMIFVSGLFSSSVDFWGHFGGLIGGGLLGSLLAFPNGKERYSIHERIISVAIFIFLIVVCMLLSLKKSGLLL